MKKGVLFIAALSMLVILPNWLWNESSLPLSLNNQFTSHAALANIPASKTGVTIAFDLNGVLFTINTKKAFDQLGGINVMAQYIAKHGINPFEVKETLLARVYEFFDTIQEDGNTSDALDIYGNHMPGLMCDWLAGRKNNAELRALVADALRDNPDWFGSAVEKTLVKRVIDKMFIPELLISTMVLIPEGLEYAKQCKSQGHTLFILSNWDSESFPLLLDKFPELFALFDGIIISGDIKQIKPESEAYALLVDRKTRYNEMVIFIDDQKENSDKAQSCGLWGIHYKPERGLFGFGTHHSFKMVERYVSRLIQEHVPYKKGMQIG